MKQLKPILLILVSVLCLNSCTTEDYEIDVKADRELSRTRAIENPTQLVIHLCVTYDPSIIDYDHFVIFNRITISSSVDPNTRYTKSVSYWENNNQRVGTIGWRGGCGVLFTVDMYDVIPQEYWNVDVDCRLHQGYYNTSNNYKVSLYTYVGDIPQFIDSHICYGASGGDDFKLSTDSYYFSGLESSSLGEHEYFLSLNVEPVE